MKPEELQTAPKLFCENIRLGFTREYFALGLSSGAEGEVYAVTPGHAKRLQQYLAHEIAKFEKEYGTINAEWNPNIVSPVQKINPPTETS